MNFANDIPLLYADFGLKLTHRPLAGGSSTTDFVIVDKPGLTVLGGDVIASDLSLRYPASRFPLVKRGDVFVNPANLAESYTAREQAQAATVEGDEYIVPLLEGGA